MNAPARTGYQAERTRQVSFIQHSSPEIRYQRVASKGSQCRQPFTQVNQQRRDDTPRVTQKTTQRGIMPMFGGTPCCDALITDPTTRLLFINDVLNEILGFIFDECL
ncbi:hypothetical protein Hypma_009763 [Hypsizygus marmoreus]|uniref:Uncharacterized protein n=1 Tax=Hypsizygus marmoreus TaxID=39966 RepID=A0A369JWD8_HYPMA|nr:hypothetical protein Hypma_009763 [Hypsizygus marmoreus]